MKRPESDSSAARQRSLAAAEWLVRLDRGLTAAEQDAFSDWLAADPRHGEWLALHRGLGGNFDRFAPVRAEAAGEPDPELLARPSPRFRWLLPATLAAAAVFAFAFFRPGTTVGDSGAEIAGATEPERRILSDGSAIDLNRGAVVTVDYAAGVRRVALLRGEALFTVAKDPARPFVVSAGGLDVRAVGTAFNVRLGHTSVDVLVTEGQVAVSTASTVARRAEVPRLSAGQRAKVAREGSAAPEIGDAAPDEIERLRAAQPQLLDFSAAPLAAAIAELNRRNRVQFVLADPELAAMPVVASIRSDRIEGFAQFLAATPGVRVERRGEDKIVLSRRP